MAARRATHGILPLRTPVCKRIFAPAVPAAKAIPPPACLSSRSHHSKATHRRRPPTRPAPSIVRTSPAISHPRRAFTSLLSALPNLSPRGVPPLIHEVHARRTLRYTPAQVYALIADVDAYASFLPYCQASRVTAWTSAPSDTAAGAGSSGPGPGPGIQRWPRRADLTVGWGPFTESYTSRLYCVPGEVVEAVSGAAEPTIPRETLARLGLLEDADADADGDRGVEPSSGSLFKSLVTRWTVRPTQGGSDPTAWERDGAAVDWTEVTLSVQFQLANPSLGLLVGHLADEKADEMILAFEGRARKLYG